MASTPYQSCPIALEKGAFRLLRLRPSIHQDFPLTGELYAANLFQARGQYEAISYVWGTADRTHTIQLCVQNKDSATTIDFPITKSLWAALFDFHLQHSDRILWADALCINQDDNNPQEKNHQVAQMRHVYANSKCTIAHLGDPFYGINALLAHCDCLEADSFFSWRPLAPPTETQHVTTEGHDCMRWDPQDGIITCRQKSGLLGWALSSFSERSKPTTVAKYPVQVPAPDFQADGSGEERLPPIQARPPGVLYSARDVSYAWSALFARPWFSRIWIVQEAAVAPNLHLYLGRYSLGLQDIKRYHDRFCFQPVASEFNRALVDSSLVAFFSTLELRSSQDTPPPLLHIISQQWASIPMQATQPRDRLFALLGLSQERDEPRFAPDYSGGVSDDAIFLRYAQALVVHPTGVGLLDDPRRHDNPSLPSWVPHFAADNQSPGDWAIARGPRVSDTPPNTPYFLRPCGRQLEVAAVFVDDIDFVGSALPHIISIATHATSMKGIAVSERQMRVDLESAFQSPVVLPQGHSPDDATRYLFRAAMQGGIATPLSPPRNPNLDRYARAWYDTLLEMYQVGESECHPGYYYMNNIKDQMEILDNAMKDPDTDDLPIFKLIQQGGWPLEVMQEYDPIPTDVMASEEGHAFMFRSLVYVISVHFSHLVPASGRRIGKTRDGDYLCNSPEAGQVGDRIAIVDGCQTPIVVRRTSNGNYRMVGHCTLYVEKTCKDFFRDGDVESIVLA